MSTAKTAWMARLGMRHPIIQAPMAGTSTPALAAAVTEAGGLGSLGIGASGTEQARQQIVQTRALTSGAFNVNLFCHRPARADAQREAAWLAHLAPEFARFGATPPATLNEIYATAVGNAALQAMLLQERPAVVSLSLIHISEPTRIGMTSYAVFCLKKKIYSDL